MFFLCVREKSCQEKKIESIYCMKKMKLESVVKKIKEDQMNEGILGKANNLMDKARSVVAGITDIVEPGAGSFMKSLGDAGMSDNELIAFLQNFGGPALYTLGAIPTLIQKAKSGDPQSQKALEAGFKKAVQLGMKKSGGQQAQLGNTQSSLSSRTSPNSMRNGTFPT